MRGQHKMNESLSETTR